ncbi:MAG TPA: hypothetical protein VIK20_02585, partial [Bacteroidales bacterium]
MKKLFSTLLILIIWTCGAQGVQNFRTMYLDNGNNRTILVTDTIMPDSNGQINISLAKTEGTFAYLPILKINEVKTCVADTFWKTKEPYHIAFMGSSVAYGTGATNNQGYAYSFKQMLTSRWNKKAG